jgi:PAS domain S-box-containing protein
VQESTEKRSFDRLAAINRAISTSLNFNEVLQLIVVNAVELLSAQTSLLMLADDDGRLSVRAAHGVGAADVTGLSGDTEESVMTELCGILELKSFGELVTVPIDVSSLNGLLSIVRETELDPDERWQLSALSDYAAIALNNARLHELETGEAFRQRDVTRKALRESNRKIGGILESITDLFYHLDREFRFIEINGRAAELFDKRPQELIGRKIWDVVPGAIGSPLHANLIRAMSERVVVHFEESVGVVPGVWFEVHAHPSQNGLFVYLRDITGRKEAEITTSWLAAIVESSDDAIVSKDLNGIITSWNGGAARIFGYEAEEVIGKPVTILIPPDRIDEEPTILGRIRLGERVDHYETIRRRKDGTLIDISVTVSPIKDAQGEIVGASKIVRDVTQRKRAEEEIRFQAHLLNAVEQAVIASDLQGRIIYWNAFAERLYGWTAGEAIGSVLLDLTPAETLREKASEILSQLLRGESWSGEFMVRRKDGSLFPAMVTDSPIFSAQGELIGVVGVSVDISERKAAEEQRLQLLENEREARSQAERANSLKDEFLATLSHELRNPLNVILGYSEVLLRSEEARKSASLRRAIEILRRNALTQSHLVRDLLDLSRLHTGKLSLNREAVSLSTAVHNAVETVREEAAAKNIEIDVSTNEEVVFVAADPFRLEQMVWNLLSNAVKFTPPGGRVEIRSSSDGDNAVFSVKDNGEGIDPQFLPEVFEMFRQADGTFSRKHGGMGIGLALVRQLAGLHGGAVTAASEGVGKGAEFTIRLPLSRETTQSGITNPSALSGELSDVRILVVDDSEDALEMLRALLELDGATVTTATSGANALGIAADNAFDLVVSDISMPGMDGFEFLNRLRAMPNHRQVPAVALTGFGRDEDRKRAKKEGFLSHITKPLNVDSLLEILHKIATKSRRSQAS